MASKSKKVFQFKYFSNLKRHQSILSNILIYLGFTLLVFVVIFWQFPTLSTVIASKSDLYFPAKESTSYPVTIELNQYVGTKDIVLGSLDNNQWTLSPDKAVYLKSSGTPGNAGNIVIYGHDTWNVFGYLYKSKLGDKITITTNDGQKFTYTVTGIKIVNSYDLDIIKPTSDQTLTIFTCSGLFDTQRLVVTAKR